MLTAEKVLLQTALACSEQANLCFTEFPPSQQAEEVVRWYIDKKEEALALYAKEVKEPIVKWALKAHSDLGEITVCTACTDEAAEFLSQHYNWLKVLI